MFSSYIQVMEDPGFEHLESDFETRKSLHPVQRGLVKDWDMLESLWRIMLDDIGIVSSDTTSVCHASNLFDLSEVVVLKLYLSCIPTTSFSGDDH